MQFVTLASELNTSLNQNFCYTIVRLRNIFNNQLCTNEGSRDFLPGVFEKLKAYFVSLLPRLSHTATLIIYFLLIKHLGGGGGGNAKRFYLVKILTLV